MRETTHATLVDTPFPGMFPAAHIAKVVSVKDDTGKNLVQVRVMSADGVDGQDGPVWARVAVPFAGADYGAFFIPNEGDEVLVVFLNGDPRFPVVVGSMWNGKAKAPETIGGDGKAVDRWSIVGRAGTRIAIVEDSASQPQIILSTPGKVSAEYSDANGGKLELKTTSSTLKADTQGVTLQTSGKVTVSATEVEITAGKVTVNSAMSTFSGVVKCDTLIATTVVGTSYTPGAGNIW